MQASGVFGAAHEQRKFYLHADNAVIAALLYAGVCL